MGKENSMLRRMFGGAVLALAIAGAASAFGQELDETRFTGFNDWQSDPNIKWFYKGGTSTTSSPTNWFLTVSAGADQWLATGVNVANVAGDAVKPDGYETLRLYFREIQGAQLISPVLDDGVGTIYFTSCVTKLDMSAEMAIQITTNSALENATWETVKSILYAGDKHAEPVCVNRADVRHVRFVRLDGLSPAEVAAQKTNLQTYAIALDNVAISRPPTTISASSISITPPQPDVTLPISASVEISCDTPDAPATNIGGTLYYKPAGGAWTQVAGTANGNVVTAEIAPLAAGTYDYYFSVTFDGVSYSRDPDGTGPQPLNDESQSPYVTVTNQFIVNTKNTRILSLSGDLDFGLVATNATKELPLILSNSGNAALTVEEISLPPACFSVTPTSLVIPPDGVVTAMVAFAPAEVQNYDGTLTVVGDMTEESPAGADTISIYAEGREAQVIVIQPVSGPYSATRLESVTFAAEATDNYEGALEYRFDWGDESTSAWATASSQSHAWQTTGEFSVRAQARSSDTLFESPWTDAASISVTNTFAIRLAGSFKDGALDFGDVQLTKSATNTVKVCNDGTGPIEVTAVTVPAGYAVELQSFTLDYGAETNVDVVFTPTAIDTFSGTLEVASDAVSGTSTCAVTGNGIATEFVSTPTIPAGPEGGVRTYPIEFRASATNLYKHAVEYRFDWGDGSTSDWAQVSLQTHNWDETGDYSVRAQARCGEHADVVSDWSDAANIAITNVRLARVSGALAFGSVATNATKSLGFTLYNDGTEMLTITSFECPDGFVASPSAFALGIGSNQVVTVDFVPSELKDYNGDVTVVSDAMNGPLTVNVSGKGIEAEMIYGVAINGPSEGIRTKTLTFSASATNNWDRGMQYRFDWGDSEEYSGWGNASRTHSWNTIGEFDVRVQARSQSDTNVVSVWSQPITVKISDTRIIAITAVPDLSSLMSVITNTIATATIRVSNSGTGPLSVTNLVFDPVSVFSAEPTEFTVEAGASQDVTVTFAPAVAGDYSTTLSVLSDKTSGADTFAIAADSTDSEEIETPSLSTDVGWYGTTNQAIRFIARSSTSFARVGHTVAYQYDWDDDGLSGWLSNGTQTHSWPTFGKRIVKVQARCATDEAYSEMVSQSVAILDELQVSVGTALNGKPVPVQVTIPATNGVATSCAIHVFPFGSGAVDSQSIPLTPNGDGTWSGTIPSLGAGEMEYFVTYELPGIEGEIQWPYDGNVLTTEVSEDLGDVRFADFTGWVTDSGSRWYYKGSSSIYTNYFKLVSNGADRWSAYGVRAINQAGEQQKPADYVTYRLYFHSFQGAMMVSPKLDGGVGTIYFTSVMRQAEHKAVLEIQVTKDDSLTDAEWTTVAVETYSGARDEQHASPVVVNDREVTYVRFIRTSLNTDDGSDNLWDGALAVDNVAISYPPSDVVITEEFLPKPAYPSMDETTVVRCRVTDVDSAFPAINRRVSVVYRHQPDGYSYGPWQTVEMKQIGDDLYEGEIPPQDPGKIYYYYRCDFDGYHYVRDPDGSGAQPTNDENMSPAFGYTEEDADGNYYYRFPVRRFLSDCEVLRVDSEDVREDLRDMSLVGDYTWQGIVSVSDVTNLLWRFQGINGYTNDAVVFESEPRVWAENDQDFPYPPVAGLAERDGANEIQALLEYNGFLLLRINTETCDYIVKRAVYQDFNAWQADDSHFEESLGKFAVQTFQDDINSWDVDSYAADHYLTESFNNNPVDADYVTHPTTTDMKWTINQAKIIQERRTNSTANANMALNMSHLTGGSVGNSGLSMTEGIEDFAFKARASLDDQNYMVYKKSAALAWQLPYTITTKLRASEIANSRAYVSVLACFQVGFGDSIGSFYEVRLIQDDDNNRGADSVMRIALYRWNDGVPERIGNESNQFNGRLNSVASEMVIAVEKGAGNTSVVFTVTYLGHTFTFTDNSANRLTEGSFGFMCFDAVPVISALKVISGSTSLFANVTDCSKLVAADWFCGGKRADNGANRWTYGSSGITRTVPSQTLQAYVAPADGVAVADYEKFIPIGNQVTINKLTYQSFKNTMKRWDRSFVQLRVVSGDVPVVVDDLSVTPWRAATRDMPNEVYPTVGGVTYEDWSSWQSQQYQWLRDIPGWAVLEGWVGTSSGSTGKEVQFDRSRANTNIVQALVSPVMTNGIGSIAFDYRTEGGKVHFAIERSNEGDPSTYTEVTNVLVSAATAAATRYSCAVRADFSGRIRVRILDDTEPRAILKIDNLVARDYPPRDETDWVAYNVMITDKQNTRLYEGQSCYLNNSPTRDVVGGALNEWAPYVQTPKVGTGIGEVGFWCRVWDLGGTGELELRVCKEVDDEEDTFLTNIVVTSDSYEYVSLEPYDIENYVLRIYSSTNSGMSRVCIDEVVMTEPVRAGYEIFDVKLVLDDPKSQQPLYTDKVAVEAKVGRFLMNPQNIQLHLSYFIGTNTWGIANWRGYELDPARGCVTLDMEDVGDNTYRTVTGQFIPKQAVDTVVQYVVWGTYDGIEGRPVLMEAPDETTTSGRWVNPEWYYPVDLNAGKAAWSPYYFSYSCPPYSVWINEINYPVKISSEAGSEYVELIGRTGYGIGDWRIEVVSPYDSMTELYRSVDIPGDTTLKEENFLEELEKMLGYVPSEEEIEEFGYREAYTNYFDLDNDGWAYYVWGDVDNPWTLNGPDLVNDDDTSYMLPQNGGIRLIRSMGAYEHSVAYGPGDLAKELEDYGYEYIGYKFTLPPIESPLQLQGDGTSVTNFYWRQPSSYTYTPGHINVDQSLSNVVIVVTKYYVYSFANNLGTQSALLDDVPVSISADGIEVEEGQKVELTYVAKPWCHIASLESNGEADVSAVGLTSYALVLRNIKQDYSNEVVFALQPECVVSNIDDSAMQAWLAGKSATTKPLDNDGYGLYVEYALDTDPTIDNEYDLAITAFGLDDETGRAVVDFVIKSDDVAVTDVQDPILPADLFNVDATLSLNEIDWQPVGEGSFEYVAADGVWRWTSNAQLDGDCCLRVRIANP